MVKLQICRNSKKEIPGGHTFQRKDQFLGFGDKEPVLPGEESEYREEGKERLEIAREAINRKVHVHLEGNHALSKSSGSPSDKELFSNGTVTSTLDYIITFDKKNQVPIFSNFAIKIQTTIPPVK